ncbi:MAG: TIGR04076 family protein [Sedimentisphaerales bacterium]|nr:TIGR04076 family protein [Sedimentisphaerales bacterium]
MGGGFAVEKHRVRITVLKKCFHKEFVEQYAGDPAKWGECGCFEVGQEFVVSGDRPWDMPVGFCGWAWADIQKLVYGMSRGGQDVFVTCCTDGYRPVIFKLEKLDA